MIEIEIVTTKKKLTKSLFTQIPELSVDEIDDDIETIGFVNNFGTNKDRIIIVLLRRFDYRIVYWDWNDLGVGQLYREGKDNRLIKTFNSELECSKYYNALQEYKQYSEQIYI